ncbi:hypothetical protein SACT1_1449 [Streptomyces sp. ACT-1]|uniref:hypothetical protein n=1 Tax=unclassified Streptomyces TaxID=2593676 RepID=UPI0001C1C98E|nr:hypothetical protein [Streptomyces sp. ACT-1]EGE40814.1 hypothetical protein SACT1_1449 [Streptomyces sp. ACT-1]
MTPPITPPSAPMSAADREAHEMASYRRRPAVVSQGSVTLPAESPARRRLIALRRL